MGLFQNFVQGLKKGYNESNNSKYEAEELSKKVASIMDNIISLPQFDENQFEIGIKQILLKKRQRATSESDYFDSLIKNITYLIEYRRAIGILIIAWMVENKKILSVQESNNKALMIREETNNPEFLKKRKLAYKKKIQGITFREKIQDAEALYANAKAANDLMIWVLNIFTEPKNKKLVESFYNYPSQKVFQTFDRYCIEFSVLINKDVKFQ